jgi:hypothetical protein
MMIVMLRDRNRLLSAHAGADPWRRESQVGGLRAALPLRVHRVPSGARRIPETRERRRAVHAAELAVVTDLIARETGRPSVLLPVVLMCQPGMPLLVCREDGTLHMLEDLAGARIGVRSYSATATWVRALCMTNAASQGRTPVRRPFDANVAAFETITEYAFRQGITTQRPGFSELFAY